jgi:hypothetical protein
LRDAVVFVAVVVVIVVAVVAVERTPTRQLERTL